MLHKKKMLILITRYNEKYKNALFYDRDIFIYIFVALQYGTIIKIVC